MTFIPIKHTLLRQMWDTQDFAIGTLVIGPKITESPLFQVPFWYDPVTLISMKVAFWRVTDCQFSRIRHHTRLVGWRIAHQFTVPTEFSRYYPETIPVTGMPSYGCGVISQQMNADIRSGLLNQSAAGLRNTPSGLGQTGITGLCSFTNLPKLP